MKALVIYCHPHAGSFNAGVLSVVMRELRRAGAEIRLHDLYAEGFQAVMTEAEWQGYENTPENRVPVEQYCTDLEWCDALIFVYPTWWYGLPAMIKGWLDRVMLPDVAFLMPKAEGEVIRPGLRHITRLGVFTTCGASWRLTRIVGAPGRRTLMRGVGFNLNLRARKVFAAHYLMDSSTPESRANHLRRVEKRMRQLLRPLSGETRPELNTEGREAQKT